MDEAIIERFNQVMGPGDVLWHLGDVAWSSWDIKNQFLSRLRCKNVHLILGNHDNREPKEYSEMGFRSVQDYRTLRMDVVRGTPQVAGSSRAVALFHYPMRSWDGKGRGGFQMYGHCHGALEPGLDRSMDVGVDTHDFYPWAWEEVRGQLLARPIFSPTTEREFTTGLGAAHENKITEETR